MSNNTNTQPNERIQVLSCYGAIFGSLIFITINFTLTILAYIGIFCWANRYTKLSKDKIYKAHFQEIESYLGAAAIAVLVLGLIIFLFNLWDSTLSTIIQFGAGVFLFAFIGKFYIHLAIRTFKAYHSTAPDKKVLFDGKYDENLGYIDRKKKYKWLKVIIAIDVIYLLCEIGLNTSIAGVSSGLVLNQDTIDKVEFYGRTLSGIGLGLFIASFAIPVKLSQSQKWVRLFVILTISVPVMHKLQDILVEGIVSANQDKANLANMVVDVRDYGINFPQHFNLLKNATPEGETAPSYSDTLTILSYFPFTRISATEAHEESFRKPDNLKWVDPILKRRLERSQKDLYQAVNQYLKLVQFNVDVHNAMVKHKLPFNLALEAHLIYRAVRQAEQTFMDGPYKRMQSEIESVAEKRYRGSRVRKKNLRDIYRDYRIGKQKGKLNSKGIYGLKFLRRNMAINLNWIFSPKPKEITYFDNIRLFELCDSNKRCPGDDDWDYTLALKYIEKQIASSETPWEKSYVQQETGIPYGLTDPRDLSRYTAFFDETQNAIIERLGFRPLIEPSDLSREYEYGKRQLKLNDVINAYSQADTKYAYLLKHLTSKQVKERESALNDVQLVFRTRPDGKSLPFNNTMFSSQVSVRDVMGIEEVKDDLRHIMGDFYFHIDSTSLRESEFEKILNEKIDYLVVQKQVLYAWNVSSDNKEKSDLYLKTVFVPPIALGFSLFFIFVTLIRVIGYPFELKAIKRNEAKHLMKSSAVKSVLALSFILLFTVIGINKPYADQLVGGSEYFTTATGRLVGFCFLGAQSFVLTSTAHLFEKQVVEIIDHPEGKIW
ncbi:TPA: hypothetical protein NG672_002659 [Vibrio parahaemolyticus]|uniref:hypothetical protein n=1 Tax=Vibrio parahaemolyticus TaxID=670 RepID=UPI001121DDAC|nr:hypothetical protein [Vibrio parahaemolyticus]MBE4118698.1 hypothetical protein [Vibrio parahaemolyticus]MBE5147991.1 hypothetical protein [Vibrio parahaemolyticus]TOE76763.1 hypothetical protein CGJ36_09075 [Vibrio parahaemolyticus]HCE2126240.1 hypothetical protein [Vibrio parahaemolyticus]HCE3635242.1 hypothetical protein [Vibrio parahaemolyticus]